MATTSGGYWRTEHSAGGFWEAQLPEDWLTDCHSLTVANVIARIWCWVLFAGKWSRDLGSHTVL